MARALMPLTSSAVFVASASCTPTPVLTQCADIDASACYSNADCESSYHCTWNPLVTNLDQVAITCCVLGPRGAADAGSTCVTMDDCGSGVCAYTPNGLVCSAQCTGKADAPDTSCPTQLPWCVPVDPVAEGLFPADGGVDGGGFDAGSFCGLAP